jgi:hypothetical protein
MSSRTPKEPLMNDGLDADPPSKRALQYVLKKKEEGWPVAGIYCGYAPLELMHAMGIVPALLSISIAAKHSGLAMKKALRTWPGTLSVPHSPPSG